MTQTTLPEQEAASGPSDTPVDAADLKRIQENVAKMRGAGASEADVLGYLKQEDALLTRLAQARAAQARAAQAQAAQRSGGAANETASQIIRAALRGATFGYNDELSGKINDALLRVPGVSGHLPQINAFAQRVGIAPLVPGDQETARVRAGEQAFDKAHPVGSRVASAAGALASPLNALIPVGGTSISGVALRGALGGAAAGALSGAGEAAPGHRVAGAVGGGAIGAGLGAVLPGSVAAYRAFRQPADAAAVQVAEAVAKSGGPKAVMGEVQRLGGLGLGNETMLADASPGLRGLADNAATLNDDARATIASATGARQAEQSQRVLDAFRRAYGEGPSIANRMADLVQARQEWAEGPSGFQGLRDMNLRFEPRVYLAELGRYMNQPQIRQALDKARQTGMIGDVPDVRRPVSFQQLQDVKEALDDQIESAFRNGHGNLGARLKESRDAIVRFMVNHVPDYATVSGEYARRKGLEEALTLGAEWWNKHDLPALTKLVSSMSKEQLEQFRAGLAGKIVEELSSAKSNRDVASRIVDNSLSDQRKMQLVFGDMDTFHHFIDQMTGEQQLGRLRQATQGSPTARRENAILNTMSGITSAAGLWMHNPALIPTWLLTKGLQAASRKAATEAAVPVANLLTTRGPDAIQQLLAQLSGTGGDLVPPALQAALTGPSTSQAAGLFGSFAGHP